MVILKLDILWLMITGCINTMYEFGQLPMLKSVWTEVLLRHCNKHTVVIR